MNTILVVDDNMHNRYIARFLLEHAGYIIDEASSGPQALEISKTKQFDLVLMDIQMPGMDGVETMHFMREQGVAAPIIALTAKAMQGDREKLLAQGCDGYISKPFKVEEFVAQVQAYLNP